MSSSINRMEALLIAGALALLLLASCGNDPAGSADTGGQAPAAETVSEPAADAAEENAAEDIPEETEIKTTCPTISISAARL